MSDFVKHEPCPHCGSRDNLGVYDDGHKFCFGCGYVEKGNGFHKFNKKEKKDDRTLSLPTDCISRLPINPVRLWLDRYQITDDEIYNNKFQWSEDKQMLVMPVYDVYGNLTMWQGRRFNTYDKKGKYFTQGNVESVYHILGYTNPKRIIVVEDLISAIKVARVATVMPLFGSNISNERLVELARRFENLVIWLDFDKAAYTTKVKQTARLLFEKVSTILTKRDPKEHSESDIKSLLVGR